MTVQSKLGNEMKMKLLHEKRQKWLNNFTQRRVVDYCMSRTHQEGFPVLTTNNISLAQDETSSLGNSKMPILSQ